MPLTERGEVVEFYENRSGCYVRAVLIKFFSFASFLFFLKANLIGLMCVSMSM